MQPKGHRSGTEAEGKMISLMDIIMNTENVYVPLFYKGFAKQFTEQRER